MGGKTPVAVAALGEETSVVTAGEEASISVARKSRFAKDFLQRRAGRPRSWL